MFLESRKGMIMKEKWTFIEWTSAIADTGDYDSGVEFTNGKDILCASGEDVETEDLEKFCELMDLMPDLSSRKEDELAFENSQLKKQVQHLKSTLEMIANAPKPYNEREAFSFVETAHNISVEALKTSEDLF